MLRIVYYPAITSAHHQMSLIKNSINVGLLTLISRLFGYIRDTLTAHFLGTSMFNEAFIVAFRLPNLFRTIFGEGAFTAAFTPLFTSINQNDPKKAHQFSRNILSIMLIGLLVLTMVMMIFMPWIIELCAPGFKDNKELFDFTVQLGRIMFPYIAFVSMMAFFGAILNSIGKFFAFASAPIIMNVIMITALFIGVDEHSKTIILSYSATFAGILQALWVLLFCRRYGYKILPQKPKIDAETKTLFARITPALFGSSIAQINVWLSTILASFIPSGVTYLYYAERVYQLPLALIGTALGTVLLPTLAKEYNNRNSDKANSLIHDGISFSMVFSIPSFIFCAYFADEIISLLFEHGKFDQAATIQTAKALQVFAFAIPLYILTKIFTSAFFSIGDTKTPVKIAAISLIINIGTSYLLLDYFEHTAIAFGSVLGAIFTTIALAFHGNKKQLFTLKQGMASRYIKLAVANKILLIALLMLDFAILDFKPIINFLISSSLLGSLYLLWCWKAGLLNTKKS